jgi:hypothetical protein
MNRTSLVSLLRTFSDSLLLTAPNPSDFVSDGDDLDAGESRSIHHGNASDQEMDESCEFFHEDLSYSNIDIGDSDLGLSSSRSLCQSQGNHSDLRKKIMDIQTDSSIPANEKSKKIQELMSSKWNNKQREELESDGKVLNLLKDKREDFTTLLPSDKEISYHSPTILGCKHYQRRIKLQAHCCGNWYVCRFCHDEVSDHTITR